MIYKEALHDHNVEVKWECSTTNNQRNLFKTYGTPSILYVSKSVHAQVEPIWYAQSHFVLDFGSRPIGGIKRFVEKIGSDNANSIRKISLRFQPFEMIAGEPTPMTDRLHAPLYTDSEWPGYRTKGLLHQIHGCTRPFPRLQDFRLKFYYPVIDYQKLEVAIELYAPLIKDIRVLFRGPDAYVGKREVDEVEKDRVVALIRHYQRLVIEVDGLVFKHYQCLATYLVNEGDGLEFEHYHADDLKDDDLEEEKLQAWLDDLRLNLR